MHNGCARSKTPRDDGRLLAPAARDRKKEKKVKKKQGRRGEKQKARDISAADAAGSPHFLACAGAKISSFHALACCAILKCLACSYYNI